MKIKLTSVYVDDQDKALRFYTEVLGFAKKTDFSQGPFRWLTVASPEETDGTEQLALNDNPAAKAYHLTPASYAKLVFAFISECRSESSRNRVHLAPDSPLVEGVERSSQPFQSAAQGFRSATDPYAEVLRLLEELSWNYARLELLPQHADEFEDPACSEAWKDGSPEATALAIEIRTYF